MEEADKGIFWEHEDHLQDVEIGFDDPVFTTGVISRLLGVPVWILKQLDQEGIVRPKRKSRKARLYTKRELKRIRHVQYLMEEKKVKLTSLKAVLEMEKDLYRGR